MDVNPEEQYFCVPVQIYEPHHYSYHHHSQVLVLSLHLTCLLSHHQLDSLTILSREGTPLSDLASRPRVMMVALLSEIWTQTCKGMVQCAQDNVPSRTVILLPLFRKVCLGIVTIKSI